MSKRNVSVLETNLFNYFVDRYEDCQDLRIFKTDDEIYIGNSFVCIRLNKFTFETIKDDIYLKWLMDHAKDYTGDGYLKAFDNCKYPGKQLDVTLKDCSLFLLDNNAVTMVNEKYTKLLPKEYAELKGSKHGIKIINAYYALFVFGIDNGENNIVINHIGRLINSLDNKGAKP